jgi:Asp-tRNA(Asn)/Glu-tRNA(Gln) amidotransferase A subunit family amidase
MSDKDRVASIDIHPKVLTVVVGSREGEAISPQGKLERRRFGTMASDRRSLLAWLQAQGVKEDVVMESTGQYGRPIWWELEPRLGYKQALWAVAHRLCRLVWKILHDGAHYIEQGEYRDPKAKKQRAQALARALRKLGYDVVIVPTAPATAKA